ncbi:MAG: LamG domain-containing protein [Deltaproteobacteria bacterium]|nr:LamG domain-containing protein [Deltaproteobacteria bacterium]MBI3388226.1 LamG domain-containing protein [Deltaproteobacteria bacterium]
MTRPWVALVAGACLLVTVGVVVQRFRGSDAEEPAVARNRMAALAGKAIAKRGGLVDYPEGADAGSPGHFDAPAGAAAVGGARGAGAAVSGSTGDATEPSERGSATVGSVGSRARGSVGVSGSSAPISAGNSISVTAPVVGPALFEKPSSPAGGGTDESIALVPSAGGPGKQVKDEKQNQDENGPVLALSFDNSVQPDKGDQATLAEGIAFDGQGTKFSEDAQFTVPNAGGLTGEAGTISFKIQPDWSGAEETDASLAQLRTPNEWDNRLQITKNGQYLRFLLADDTGHESGAGIPIRWQPGEEHTVTATWGEDPTTGQKLASLYVDGRLAGQSPYYGNFIPPNGPLYIGSDHPGGGPGARGTMSDFQAYNRALSLAEIANRSTR